MGRGAILFDFGGTLDSDGLCWKDRFYPIYLRQGLNASSEDFSKAFYDTDDHLPFRYRLEGLGLEETLRLHVRSVLTVLAPKNMDLTERIVQPFLYESRDSFRKAKPILERLKARYPLGIVSNFYGNLESILEGEGLRSFFTVIADSSKVGFLKPAPEIFLYAMNRIGAGPAQTWMIGDSLRRDMKGAETLGLSHVWLRANRDDETPPCCDQGKVVNSLEEVEFCLGSPALA